MTDFRALCAEMANELDHYYIGIQGHDRSHPLAVEARAALAEAYEAEANNPPEGHPDPEPFQAILRERAAALAQHEVQGPGPTDEELLGIEDLEAAWNAQADAFNSWDELGIDEIVCWTQRQALARWGRPAKPEVQGPTEAQLKTFACEWWHSFGFAKDKATCTWVIDHVAPEHFADFSRDVLARWSRPTTEPVPVSERPWEREGWCDPVGKCWWWNPATNTLGTPWWSYEPWEWVEDAAYSLPHWALPVPNFDSITQGE